QFSAKFPHKHEKRDNDDHEKKNKRYSREKEFKKFDHKKNGKKIFYTKEEAYYSEANSKNNSSDSDFDSNHKDLGDEFLFMIKCSMRSTIGGSSLLGDFLSGYCKDYEEEEYVVENESTCAQSEL
ncbi:hypothetical protein KI387_024298, partial [Taxus chinensis]